MSQDIAEREWRILRELKPIALERLCQRVLSELVRIASDDTKGAHERYLAIFKVINQRDDEIASAFNDLRRSTAMQRLACMKYLELLTEEEMSRFSPETRDSIDFYVETLLR
jgi:hypothetical protein